MKQSIQGTFERNLERVDRLIEIYNEVRPSSPGRPLTAHSDLLRAVVVLLHATVEDLLRNLERWRLPQAAPDQLSSAGAFRLLIDGREKTTVSGLALHRGKSVDDLIAESVEEYLERSNYNNTKQVAAVLKRIRIDTSTLQSTGSALHSMMARRHWIAHRADENPQTGSGHHHVQPIDVGTVERWRAVVERFGGSVLRQC